ncbi:beta-Ig-H3/fasciclin [Chroococcidiopsis sp. CCALA 051]|uniref:fasciclin domain-containing protein n=1 Tax=Chroococcidiopsis sp. CCALA 051 TaxID=869949 RepID=UPI000D0C9771|nr:fasciclin domain-containing protein [Chroococcidiopsis sp. CCALA 051]MBE9015484.1 fasciclin domain-containing protein [Chroococcidiopsidales cyanobacterium LEGE 13417]PSM46966.1 beta-Ig-H3/fasciclin [Chroococcidiopsis sp. CCALA 051]
MKVQNRTNSIKKLAGLAAGLTILPIIAACEPQQTAQTPPATAPTAEATPGATTQSPAAPTAPPAAQAEADDNHVVDVVQANPSLKTLASVIDETDANEVLELQGPYTVFAPSDDAFNALPAETRQRLLQPENRQQLAQILFYHVVPGQVSANQLQSGDVKTVEGANVNVQVDQTANQVTVNDATVTQADIPASNGVIHIVDRVILPPNFSI